MPFGKTRRRANNNDYVLKFMLIAFAFIISWVMNLVFFLRTILAEDYVWSEIGVWTIVQMASILIWPLSIVTGPVSFIIQ